MKIEKLLLGLFASFLMAGCSQNDDAPNGNEEAQGKKKDSYVSISVVTNGGNGSRSAEHAGFEYGSEDESAVKTAHFFFFNQNMQAYVLQAGTSDYEYNYNEETKTFQTLSGEAKGNWLYFSNLSAIDKAPATGTSPISVEKILNGVIVFKGETEEDPAYLVAVLNCDNSVFTSASYSLEQLLAVVSENYDATITAQDGTSKKYFTMSNSVYADATGTSVIVATDLAEYTKETAEAALDNSVDVYVERVAAKVTASLAEELGTKKEIEDVDLITGKSDNDEYTTQETTVYAKPLKWDLNTTVNKSFLVKNLVLAEVPESFSWNDFGNKRSYWSTSTTGVTYDKAFSWHGIANEFGQTVAYCHENTTETNTKIIVAAQLLDSSNNPVTIAQWLVNYYYFDTNKPNDEAEAPNGWTNTLLTAVANSLDLYWENGASYSKILPSDIQVVPGYSYYPNDASEHYKVYFELTDDAKTKAWKKGSGSTAIAITKDDANNEVKLVPAAKVWQDGATYYFTDIEQFTAVPGVVRNHHYNIQITNIKGLGTPVYYPHGYTPNPEKPEENIPEIPDPVVPNDQETYLSAKINVLSWKVVNNDIELGH